MIQTIFIFVEYLLKRRRHGGQLVSTFASHCGGEGFDSGLIQLLCPAPKKSLLQIHTDQIRSNLCNSHENCPHHDYTLSKFTPRHTCDSQKSNEMEWLSVQPIKQDWSIALLFLSLQSNFSEKLDLVTKKIKQNETVISQITDMQRTLEVITRFYCIWGQVHSGVQWTVVKRLYYCKVACVL